MPLAAPVTMATLPCSFMRCPAPCPVRCVQSRAVSSGWPGPSLIVASRLRPVAGSPSSRAARIVAESARCAAAPRPRRRPRARTRSPWTASSYRVAVDEVDERDLGRGAAARSACTSGSSRSSSAACRAPGQRRAHRFSSLHAVGVEARACSSTGCPSRAPAPRRGSPASAPMPLNTSTWKTSAFMRRSVVEHVRQRRVGDDAAVPVVLAVDLAPAESRAAARRWP